MRKYLSQALVVTAVTAAASAVLVLGGGTASAAPASAGQCNEGQFCIWQGSNYSGRFDRMYPSYGDGCGETPFRAVSVWNRSGVTVEVFHGSNCSDGGTPIYPGEYHAGGDYFNSNWS
ncbi:peptidase inhibitor family I36 protein [Amycolatopsis sp. H20-H5]|uniref:peptidase inhibitor family I36 protein n=1 Tax=Amycolatopsis sp. H20-H5 TaxID=3046309 RepID=UPI002DB65B8F|nr:peptidase inhibitor family I36 protein [Amycolatopsis sp. H20-H5]MEC3978997.1 peptidase inhibitor family I36 protein [Amycolatopsis sp. H20-H5]